MGVDWEQCALDMETERDALLEEIDDLKAERDVLREVHTAAWGIIWALSPHAHHTLSVEGARIALKAACEKAQAARAALDSEGGERHRPSQCPDEDCHECIAIGARGSETS